MLLPKRIKEKNITVDRGIGEATVTITIHGKHRDEIRTLVDSKDIIDYIKRENIEVLGIIKDDSISNRYGAATGTWIFKIPTTDPENSTTTVLKRRKNNKKREVVEDDWNLGPEE